MSNILCNTTSVRKAKGTQQRGPSDPTLEEKSERVLALQNKLSSPVDNHVLSDPLNQPGSITLQRLQL